MVRTYAFNPSMQTSLHGGSSLPALVLHSAVHHQRAAAKDLHAPMDIAEQNRHQREASEPAAAAWARHQILPGMGKRPSPDSGGAPSLDGTASSSSGQQSSVVTIEEDRTTLLSIRSVLINGQRFFQPLDMHSQHPPTVNGSHQQPASPAALLAIAAVGGHPAEGRRQQQRLPEEVPMPSRPSLVREERLSWPAAEPRAVVQQPQAKSNSIVSSLQQMPPPNRLLHRHQSPPLFGGLTTSLIDSGPATPPWARGNPQPKSGQRGSREWQAAQMQKTAFDQSFGSSTVSWPPGGADSQFQQRAEQERHRLELLHQIEENRQRRMVERQREWEVEERQRLRDDLWQQRQRLEMEEERRREREKALMAELKAQKLAAAQRATEQAIREAQQQRQREPRLRGEDLGRSSAEPPQQEEWWERKDRLRAEREAGRGRSPAVPALRRRQTNDNDGANGHGQRSLSVGSRKGSSSAFDRNSRLGYSPSVASRKSTLEDRNSGRGGARMNGNGNKKKEMDFDI